MLQLTGELSQPSNNPILAFPGNDRFPLEIYCFIKTHNRKMRKRDMASPSESPLDMATLHNTRPREDGDLGEPQPTHRLIKDGQMQF